MLKKILLQNMVVWGALAGFASQATADAIGDPRLDEILATPLIAGASVSASASVPSPGHRAALRYTTADKILTIAQGGKPGVEIVPRLTPEVLADRSVLIGVDLFFWDSALDDVTASVKALETILAETTQRGIPIVIGDIPDLLGFLQSNRDVMNAKIRELCRPEINCHILALDALYQRILRDGYLEINGRRYTMDEILPDGLHVSNIASDYISRLIEASLSGT